MLNTDIPKEKLDQLKLVVFDSDGVTIPRGTTIQEQITADALSIDVATFVIQPELTELLKRLRERFVVVVSSGRALLYLESMYSPLLGKNTVLQAENGNLSLIEGKLTQHFTYDETYFVTLARIRDAVRTLPIKGVEPKQFILSVHADRELSEVYDIVQTHDKRGELKVMWNGEAFDIQRHNVSKAAGIEKLVEYFGITRDEVLAIGDRINDKEMLETVGVPVSADKEGVAAPYWTTGDKMPGEALAEYLVKAFDL